MEERGKNKQTNKDNKAIDFFKSKGCCQRSQHDTISEVIVLEIHFFCIPNFPYTLKLVWSSYNYIIIIVCAAGSTIYLTSRLLTL